MKETVDLPEDAKHYLMKLCDSSVAYEILPKDRSLHLDLAQAKTELLELGFKEVVDARVMLIMEREFQVNLYTSGRMLLRSEDETLAKQVAAELAHLLY